MNLQVEAIDLYYMHPQDPDKEIEDIVGAMSKQVKDGKVKTIGPCEVDSEILHRAHSVHQMTALQTELSMWSREPANELFDLCVELGITCVESSPLGRGFLTGAIKSRNDEICTIPETRKVHHLEENFGALQVSLAADDLALINENLPAYTVGERY